ncbi:hypothetical protein J2792_002306 [Novosphingobium capsulatum]|uniref:Uncharacterized protein n=1 Tax=Novosphingobium capsulatum TaxID=13688 RepID=A0ABU1MM73_9SPHN|nr:hypothetical protein [Novosphingobium capsulatum]
MTLPDLIARVEAAEGADRKLDAEVADFVLGPVKPPYRRGHCEKYTADLNAVVAMIPDGYSRWAVTGRNSATVGRPGDPKTEWVFASTPALALLAACLRARG